MAEFTFPDNLRYTEKHEWIDPQTGRVGISDHAQDQLGDIVYLDYTVNQGDTIAAEDVLGTIESVKTVSDIYAPASGEVSAVNEALLESPDASAVINQSPYDKGWLFTIKISDPKQLEQLMDAASYKKHVGQG
ncbi:MAG: glycine cleavage system protein GcvH [Myxococcota bacterium]